MTKIKADWLTAPKTQAVFSLLTEAGFQAYGVGGCVRNHLLGVQVMDIDIATDAHPKRVLELAKTAGLRAIPTGIDHGTVTVLSEGEPFEITCFRKDIATDGRRAVVAFSDNINDDAMRRDFTMNALYVAPDGAIIDPLNGLADVTARRLRFIGDPNQRIAEDHLRILRFFRFYALYCDPNQGLDPDGLAGIANNIEGLSKLSKERIGAEMRKLLAADDPAPAVAAMQISGVLAAILPGASAAYLAPLVALEHLNVAAPDWPRRLSIIGGEHPAKALRLSKAEVARLKNTLLAVSEANPAKSAYFYGRDVALDAALILAALTNQPISAGLNGALELGSNAVFPIRAADLMGHVATGPMLGRALNILKTRWIESGFTLDKDQLL